MYADSKSKLLNTVDSRNRVKSISMSKEIMISRHIDRQLDMADCLTNNINRMQFFVCYLP